MIGNNAFSNIMLQAPPVEKDYPDFIYNKNYVKYIYEKELGAGAYGKVYLYHHHCKPEDKVAIKLEKSNLARTCLTNESLYTRILNDDFHLDCVPKYHGDS